MMDLPVYMRSPYKALYDTLLIPLATISTKFMDKIPIENLRNTVFYSHIFFCIEYDFFSKNFISHKS